MEGIKKTQRLSDGVAGREDVLCWNGVDRGTCDRVTGHEDVLCWNGVDRGTCDGVTGHEDVLCWNGVDRGKCKRKYYYVCMVYTYTVYFL